MRIQRDTGEGRNYIGAVDPGAVTVQGTAYRQSLILTADHIAPWPPTGFAELVAEHWTAVLALEPELVVLGTGATLRFPSPAVLAPLMAAGIGYEIMGTAAACRTYNVLLAEDRRVVAALLLG